MKVLTFPGMPLTLASEASMYFFVWPSVLHLTYPWGYSWATSPSLLVGHCPLRWLHSAYLKAQFASKHTFIQYCLHLWAFHTDRKWHQCLQLHLTDVCMWRPGYTGNSPQYVATEWMNQLKPTEFRNLPWSTPAEVVLPLNSLSSLIPNSCLL